jgi:hypothetical protein
MKILALKEFAVFQAALDFKDWIERFLKAISNYDPPIVSFTYDTSSESDDQGGMDERFLFFRLTGMNDETQYDDHDWLDDCYWGPVKDLEVIFEALGTPIKIADLRRFLSVSEEDFVIIYNP